jgi:putative transposase
MDPVYPTDLTDEQWTLVEPLIPAAKPGGRPRKIDLRQVLNAIFYLNKAGCQWSMLPKDLAKRSTVNDYFNAWKADGTWQRLMDAMRQQVRVAAGHEPEPQKAAIDSQTVKGSEAGGERGLRWRQENQRPQASSGRGFLGFAAGRIRQLRQRR